MRIGRRACCAGGRSCWPRSTRSALGGDQEPEAFFAHRAGGSRTTGGLPSGNGIAGAAAEERTKGGRLETQSKKRAQRLRRKLGETPAPQALLRWVEVSPVTNLSPPLGDR